MATQPSQASCTTSSPLSRRRRHTAKGRRVKLTVLLSTVSSSKCWIPSIMPLLQTSAEVSLCCHDQAHVSLCLPWQRCCSHLHVKPQAELRVPMGSCLHSALVKECPRAARLSSADHAGLHEPRLLCNVVFGSLP